MSRRSDTIIGGVLGALAAAALGGLLVARNGPGSAAAVEAGALASLADSLEAVQAAYDESLACGNFEEIQSAAAAARSEALLAGARLASVSTDWSDARWSAVSRVAVFAARWGEGAEVLARLRAPAAERGAAGRSGPGEGELLLLLGRLLRDRGESRAAAEFFEDAVAHADSNASETVVCLAGAARLEARDLAAAGVHFTTITLGRPPGPWQARAREGLARIALAQDRPRDALASLDSLGVWEDASRPSDSLSVLALRALDAAGETERAVAFARRMLARDGSALEGLRYLQEQGAPLGVDEAEAGGRALVRVGKVDEAVALLDAAAPAAGDPAPWLLVSGEWLLQARRHAEARARLVRALDDSNASSSTRSGALLGIARSWRGEHDLSRMESAYRRAIREAPAASTRAMALWELARELDEAGHRSAALRLYRELRDGYPASENAGDARFAVGILHWREGRRHEAALAFENARERADPGAARNRALVWLAKARLAAGDTDSARLLLAEAGAAGSDDFYGLAAATLARRWKGGAFVPAMLEAGAGESSSPAPGTEMGDAQAEAGGPDAAAAMRDSASTTSDTTAARENDGAVALLLDLGFSEEAAGLLRQSGVVGEVPARLALAREALRRGSPRTAYRIAESLRWSPEARAAADFDRLRYPIAWTWQVRAATSGTGVDPLLLYSVVRQESGFDPRAFSTAGARGLLQLMPPTAAAEAHDLGMEVPADSSLEEVETNLLLGSGHMARLLQQFPGELPAALAAYNANPEKAREWRSAAAGDPDVFLEIIGWRETRAYVKTVLRNLLRYRALYY